MKILFFFPPDEQWRHHWWRICGNLLSKPSPSSNSDKTKEKKDITFGFKRWLKPVGKWGTGNDHEWCDDGRRERWLSARCTCIRDQQFKWDVWHVCFKRQRWIWERQIRRREETSLDMRLTDMYRLNEVLHRLIKKKHKGNKNLQQIDKTFTFIILKLEISF